MKITFVRHAEVIESHQGKYNGHIDIPLSKNGKKQAKDLAKKLDSKIFDKVYCSDLIRAKQTFEAFNINVPTIFTQELREKSWGIHEGKSFKEIEDSGIKYENFTQWLESLDGETVDDYTQKVKSFFFNTLAKDTSANLLVITHAGFIKTLYSVLEKSPLEQAFSLSLPYASFYILDTNYMTFQKY